MAFPGDPDQPDYQTLEVLAQDPTTNEVTLAEVKFSGGANQGADSTPKIEKNPPRCSVCHGTPARPIWDTSDTWPGVYGSSDDRFGDQSLEFEPFAAFAPKPGHTGRYQHFPTARIDRSTPFSQTPRGMPNQNLTLSLSRLNLLRIASEVVSLPRWPQLKYALVAASASCLDAAPNAADWLAPDTVAQLGITFAGVQDAVPALVVG